MNTHFQGVDLCLNEASIASLGTFNLDMENIFQEKYIHSSTKHIIWGG